MARVGLFDFLPASELALWSAVPAGPGQPGAAVSTRAVFLDTRQVAESGDQAYLPSLFAKQ